MTDPDVAHDRLPDDVAIVALTPVSNLAMGEYPASIAALDDQGDLEFVAERIYGGGETALAKVRHGNAVMLTCRPFGAGGGQVLTIGSTDWVFGLARDAGVHASRATRLSDCPHDETVCLRGLQNSAIGCIRYESVGLRQKVVKSG